MKTCLGIPFDSERPATPEEAAYVRGQYENADRNVLYARMAGWASIFCMVFGVPAMFFARYLVRFPFELIILAFLLFAVCIAIAFLRVRDLKRLRGFLSEGLNETTVSVFEGQIDPIYWIADNRLFFKNLGIAEDPSVPVLLECFERSGVVLRTNGRWPLRPERVDVAVLGEALKQPAQGVFPGQISELNLESNEQSRPLSDAELRELQSHADGLKWYKPYWRPPIMALCIYLIVGDIKRWPEPRAIFFTLLLGYVVISDLILMRRRLIMAQLNQKDVEAGAVVILYRDGRKFEILPHSGRVWTVDGTPASLRQAWAGAFNRPGKR